MTVLIAIIILMAIASAVVLVGAVIAYVRTPVTQMEDDPYLTAFGDQPHAPFHFAPFADGQAARGRLGRDAAHRSPMERHSNVSPARAVLPRDAGGNPVSGIAARSVPTTRRAP